VLLPGQRTEVRLWVYTKGLMVGKYHATVRITAPGAQGSPFAIPVSLVVEHYPVLLGSHRYRSLAEALAAASPGDWIVVGPGTYEENLVIEKPVTIVGAGPENTVIEAAKGDYPVIHIESDQPIEVRLIGLEVVGGKGLGIDGKAYVKLTDCIINVVRGFGLKVGGSARVELTDCQVGSGGWGIGISVFDSAQVELKNSLVGASLYGLKVGGSARVELRYNVIAYNKICGIWVTSPNAHVTGSGNKMHGNGADLCGYASPKLREPLVPQTDRAELSVLGDYKTIQEAIDAIAPGGTITLAPGTYEEGLTIWKPLTLKGAGPEETTLKALPERGLIVSILAEVEGVKLEGLKVTGSEGDGLWILGQAELVRLEVSGNGWYGLVVGGSAQVTLRNTQVSGNWHDGLRVYGSAHVVVWDSLIEGNGTDCPSAKIYNGIEVWDRAHLEVYGSTIRNNHAWGIGAVLEKCGYDEDDFEGEVILGDDNQIYGNGRGQVCLPDRCIPEDACK